MPAKQKEPPASEAFKALFSSVSDPLVWAQRGGTERRLRHQTSLLKGMLVRSVILFSGIDFFLTDVFGQLHRRLFPIDVRDEEVKRNKSELVLH